MSRVTRRTNTSSEQRSEGVMRNLCSLSCTRESDVIVDRCFGSLVFEVFGNDDHLNAYGETLKRAITKASPLVSRNHPFRRPRPKRRS